MRDVQKWEKEFKTHTHILTHMYVYIYIFTSLQMDMLVNANLTEIVGSIKTRLFQCSNYKRIGFAAQRTAYQQVHTTCHQTIR